MFSDQARNEARIWTCGCVPTSFGGAQRQSHSQQVQSVLLRRISRKKKTWSNRRDLPLLVCPSNGLDEEQWTREAFRQSTKPVQLKTSVPEKSHGRVEIPHGRVFCNFSHPVKTHGRVEIPHGRVKLIFQPRQKLHTGVWNFHTAVWSPR